MYGAQPEKIEKPLAVRGLRVLPAGTTGLDERNLGLSLLNSKGRKGDDDKTIGQDNTSFSHLPTGWEVLCVMDGHGKHGHWPATRSVRTVPFFLSASSCSTMLRQGQVEAALTHAFDKAQSDLKSCALSERVDLQASGCTAVSAVWRHDSRHVWVAWVGDSRAVLFAPGAGVLAETEDHKATVPTEVARIERSGGEVVSMEFDDGFVETRVNVKGTDYPGISMTRSLGDLVVKEAGVIAEPQVVQWSKPPGALLLAASDGIWEFLDTERVVQLVLEALEKGRSHQQALEGLLKVARAHWEKEEHTYCDDITAALASLDGAKSVQAPARACFEGICGTAPAACRIL